MKKLLFAAWLYLAAAIPAFANVPCSLPFNLQNGTTADASQVMANYNALVTCLGSAAGAGVNNDITQLIGLTTPISPTQGGTAVFLGGTSTGSANAQVIGSTTPSGFTLNLNYQVIFKAGFSNSGATTLAVGASGAVNVFKQTPTGPVALTGNEIQAGQIVFVFYDGTQWEMLPPLSITGGFGITVTGGTAAAITTTTPPYGFDQPINMGLTATGNAGTHILTVCITDQTGATPSATSPVLIPFHSATAATGTPVWRVVTSQLCMTTNAAGASLGVANGQVQTQTPFRLWIEVFDNAGTPVLALWHSGAAATTPVINALDETSTQNTTGISAAATNAGTFYTPNGTNLNAKSFRIVGFLEYSGGLSTVGNYDSNPTKLQLFGPGIKKPGDTIQLLYTQAATPSLSVTPTSAANLVKVMVVSSATGLATNSVSPQLSRGATVIDTGHMGSASNFTAVTLPLAVLDNPGTTSSTTYSMTGSGSINSSINLDEIMG